MCEHNNPESSTNVTRQRLLPTRTTYNNRRRRRRTAQVICPPSGNYNNSTRMYMRRRLRDRKTNRSVNSENPLRPRTLLCHGETAHTCAAQFTGINVIFGYASSRGGYSRFPLFFFPLYFFFPSPPSFPPPPFPLVRHTRAHGAGETHKLAGS